MVRVEVLHGLLFGQLAACTNDPSWPQCSVLGRSGGETELTLTAIKQSLDLVTAGRTNVSSTRCSGRRPPAARADATHPTASPQLELTRTTRCSRSGVAEAAVASPCLIVNPVPSPSELALPVPCITRGKPR